MQRRRCKGCKKMKIIGADIISRSPTCVQCTRKRKPPMGKAKPRYADFAICELARDDGFFHVKRKVNTNTVCGKPPRDLPEAFRQGFEALALLKRDPGCCSDCRGWLEAMFGDRN